MKGRSKTIEHRKALSISKKGKKYNHKIDGKNIRIGQKMKGRIHTKILIEEMERFRKEGFRIVPLHLPHVPRPDFLAFKLNTVLAVEIELETPGLQSISKYDGWRKYYDDIIWIVKK